MRGVRAAMICLVAALALPGSVHAAGPAALGEPQGDLVSLACEPSHIGGSTPVVEPVGVAVSPGDTVLVGERWS